MKGRMRVVPVGTIDYISASGAYAEQLTGGARLRVGRSRRQALERRLGGTS
jgi:DNA-binding LytR/AlgR family response regulator